MAAGNCGGRKKEDSDMTRSFGSEDQPRSHRTGDEGDGPGHHKGGGDSDQRLRGAKDEVQKLRGGGIDGS